MFSAPGMPRAQYQALFNILQTLPPDELQRHQQLADQSFLLQGITFTVYGNDEGTERIFPYDLLPRIITAEEWETIDSGLVQRITALNLFLHDIYHAGKILNDGVMRFLYGAPIMESFMEVRMEPLSDGDQRCHSFSLTTTPGAQVLRYKDFQGNIVNHFSIPAQHTQLTIKVDAVVEKRAPEPLPSSLTSQSWDKVDTIGLSGQYWDYLRDSQYARYTPALANFAKEIGFDRRLDPLTLLRWLNSVIYERFTYLPNSTRVDSPIDEALESKQGVCQDFSHIMIALVRGVGIPCC